MNNLNPKFSKKFDLDYAFEVVQEGLHFFYLCVLSLRFIVNQEKDAEIRSLRFRSSLFKTRQARLSRRMSSQSRRISL